MKQLPVINRRQFLRDAGATGAALVIGIYLSGCREPDEIPATPTEAGATATAAQPAPDQTADPTAVPDPTATPAPPITFAPNFYLKIENSGAITIVAPRPDMGQGVRTALPMLVAEELDVDWQSIRVEQAPADYGYGEQSVGGSLSIRNSWQPLRQAGAQARAMLIAAAAQLWDVDPASCRTEQGQVLHEDGERRFGYGELVETAVTLSPLRGTLKEPADFRIIGTPAGCIDAPDMITGRAVYGVDVRLPEMLYATVVHCPVFGGRLTGYDDRAALAVPGVRQVMALDRRNTAGLAVIADHTWAALQGAEALVIEWEEGDFAGQSSDLLRRQLRENAPALSTPPEEADQTITAEYECPYLAHAIMEPINCVADIGEDAGEVWATTQSPQLLQREVAFITGLRTDEVTVHLPLMGGGFGRRWEPEAALEAALISQALGRPVKVMWPRREDIQHDFYRPMSYHRLQAGLDGTGLPISWEHRISAAGLTNLVAAGDRQALLRGANHRELPYDIASTIVTANMETFPVPGGFWRAVYNTQNAFVNESFLDEIAAAGARDPYQLRRDLAGSDRLRAVLDRAAEEAGWGSPLPAGWGRGIACHATWGVTPAAQVAEVEMFADGSFKVQRVVCVVDCGQVVNPAMVAAQMEGGIAFGLSALWQAIDIEAGRVQQSNFHDFPILRMSQMPAVEVHIMASEEPPSGVGEMAVPVILPAVTNALFAATGVRIRALPLLE